MGLHNSSAMRALIDSRPELHADRADRAALFDRMWSIQRAQAPVARQPERGPVRSHLVAFIGGAVFGVGGGFFIALNVAGWW